PAELGVRGDLALGEDGRSPGIEAGREEQRGQPARVLAEPTRVRQSGEGVQVDHAEEAVVDLLRVHPLPDGAQEVPQVLVAARLDAREDPRHGLSLPSPGAPNTAPGSGR